MVLAVTSHPELERKSRIATGKLPELGGSSTPVVWAPPSHFPCQPNTKDEAEPFQKVLR